MAFSNASFSEFYISVCAENQIQINPHVLEVLDNTLLTGNVILNLSGKKWQRSVQKLNDMDAFALSKCLKNNKFFTSLDVSYNRITDEGVKHFADLLGVNSTLNSLDLRFNCFRADGAQFLAKILQGNRTLCRLRLSGNKIGDSGGMLLAMMLQINNSLMELELSACDLGIQSVITFANVLKSNRSLRCVDFSRSLLNGHEEYWVVHISNMLVVNSSLLELHLGMTGMADTGMERLAEGLKLNHSLRYLDLQYNGVSCDGAYHLANVLRKNPTLDVIDLSFNRLEDEGGIYLSKALSSPGCSLRALSVSSNNIRTDGLLALAQAVKVNPNQTQINIWGNYLEEPVCQAFKELIYSGHLLREQTDVTAYEMNNQVCLAEICNGLKKLNYRINFCPYDTVATYFSINFFKRLF
ncbi:leucine-rich repeat-containing protein 34-like isoform X2 [Takifugu rubripes]|uniref:leucine-rich repeat-containing protein 34-like isoform X2 n=1 Tax=Takifugu rubripes TaxID=31033 RepID=UPI001145633D|nr:leucine-rich repeat-containing protein 34-like isoform X2 [Takifugu rubripes]